MPCSIASVKNHVLAAWFFQETKAIWCTSSMTNINQQYHSLEILSWISKSLTECSTWCHIFHGYILFCHWTIICNIAVTTYKLLQNVCPHTISFHIYAYEGFLKCFFIHRIKKGEEAHLNEEGCFLLFSKYFNNLKTTRLPKFFFFCFFFSILWYLIDR